MDQESIHRLTPDLVACFGAERPSATVTADTDLFALLGIPNRSLSVLRIRLAVQERLGLILPPGGLDHVTTLGQLAAALAEHGRQVREGEFEALTDPETLRELADDGIPFNKGIGIQVESLWPEVRLVLPNRPSNRQHMGFLAVGGITAALEAAAGLAVSMQIDPSTYPLITPQVKLEVISALDHDMTAVSSLEPGVAKKLRSRLEKMGHAVFEHNAVGLNAEGKKAAKMTCTFYLRKVKDWSP